MAATETMTATEVNKQAIQPDDFGREAAWIRTALASALFVTAHLCYWDPKRQAASADQEHADCTTYTIGVAMRTTGKAHRMRFDLHTGDHKIYSGARPACGSTQSGRGFRGTIVPAVTCGRC